MFRTTRTVAVASLALAVLTGCGGAAAEARGSHTYEPLPPLSTATPSTSPAPQPTSRPAPASSAAPSAGASSDDTAVAADAAQAAAPSGSPVGTSVPGQEAAVVPAPAAGQMPGPVAGPVGGGAPVQVTERTSTSTTTTTSTTLEAGLKIVVTCEGLCILGDLAAPELAGQDGPLSPDLLRQALEEELSGQGADQERLTDELVEQLLRGEWDLADRKLEGGDEELVFASARR